VNILFLSDNFPPETNAAATRVYERAVYWARWGHKVTVITSFPNFPQGRLHDGYSNAWHEVSEMDGIKVVRVKTFISANRGTLLRTLDFVSFLLTGGFAALLEPKPQVVVATSPQFFTAVAGWLVGKLRHVPFVFELGDIWPASIAAVGVMKRSLAFRAIEALELFLYRQSARVVALTQAFKDNLIGRGIDPNKISVVINGVDLDRYAPKARDQDLEREWDLTPGIFTIGYVGTHGMAHDLMNVVRAAELLKDRQDIRFLLVGDGAERPMIMAEAERLGLTNIVFKGPQPKAMMPRIWSLLDVALVHLKDQDTFREVIPSKIFEAMAMGLPLLLVAPEGEASAIIDKTQAGLNVLAGQPQALADAAKRMADDRALTSRLAATSLSSAPLYSRQTQAESMMAALELAIGYPK
jgi:glycosyltransferase involved in cell wall biosynthesis